jgi:hypothetical protein
VRLKISPYVIASLFLFAAGSVFSVIGERTVGLICLFGSLLVAIGSIRDDLI